MERWPPRSFLLATLSLCPHSSLHTTRQMPFCSFAERKRKGGGEKDQSLEQSFGHGMAAASLVLHAGSLFFVGRDNNSNSSSSSGTVKRCWEFGRAAEGVSTVNSEPVAFVVATHTHTCENLSLVRPSARSVFYGTSDMRLRLCSAEQGSQEERVPAF